MKNTNYRFSFEDAVQVWLRRWNGEYQHQIAASYGVNQGRVNEILKGKAHLGSEQIAKKQTQH